jgi:NAD(P)-dependent dehydrogenase (short-subunit alcohol dehydrogenase family)
MEQRVALVTGGSRGIGLATAMRFLDEGTRVVITDISERALDAAREKLSARTEDVMLANASVTDRPAMEKVVADTLGRWGRLDALVNNAALNRPGGTFEQPDSDWQAVIDVNLTGAFVATSVAAKPMRDQGSGTIVNVGSIGAGGFGASPAYAASKAGLIGLTRQGARELGAFGITVNYVAPGVTATEWVERNLGAERIEASAASSPLKRVGTPEDVAAMITFLASPAARHVTGQVISVSGGSWMP